MVDVIEAGTPWEIVEGTNAKAIPQPVKLRVVERLKGVSPEQLEITGGIYNNAESVFLEAGKRYLLYTLQDRDGTWVTSCSRTKLAHVAAEELTQLRQCAKR